MEQPPTERTLMNLVTKRNTVYAGALMALFALAFFAAKKIFS